MNAKMSYKKAVVLMTAFMAFCLDGAGCSPCQQAAAARKSVKDEQAKLANQAVSKQAELDEVTFATENAIQPCCPDCAANGIDCGPEGKRCAACQGSAKDAAAAMLEIGKRVAKVLELDVNIAGAAAARAARPHDSSCNKPCPKECAAHTAPCHDQNPCHKPCDHDKEAKKCCKKLKHKIEDVEELVESLIDINCCSITETLLGSVIDQTADCCSVTELLITSVIDQTADCCSVTSSTLGAPTNTAIDFPVCNFSVLDFVNDAQLDVISWLKSLYLLTYQVYLCSCCDIA